MIVARMIVNTLLVTNALGITKRNEVQNLVNQHKTYNPLYYKKSVSMLDLTNTETDFFRGTTLFNETISPFTLNRNADLAASISVETSPKYDSVISNSRLSPSLPR